MVAGGGGAGVEIVAARWAGVEIAAARWAALRR